MVSVLFRWGVMQYIIRRLAWLMQVTMATTAAESLNAAGNIFLGQVSYYATIVSINFLSLLLY